MRARGVVNFPASAVTLTGNRVRIDLPHGIKTEPRFAAASRACASLLPGVYGVPAKDVNVEQELAFARCVRAHGIGDFPDPLPGGGFDVPGNTNSPQFDAATTACHASGIDWNSGP